MLWTTQDGRSWDQVSLPSDLFAKAHLRGLVATRDGFVLTGAIGGSKPVCCVNGPSDTLPAAWFSSDGQTWQAARVVHPKASLGDLIGPVFAGRSGLAAWGQRGVSYGWSSPDGRRWTALPQPAGNPILPRAADGVGIIGTSYAKNDQEAYWISADGVSWKPLAASGAVDQMPTWGSRDGPVADSWFLFADGLGAAGDNGTERSPLWFADGVTGS